MENLKISFCIVCMNRLYHLITTLPQNIEDNLDYPNLEFVILDYNSQDGMEEWVKANLTQYIDSGLVKYYRTPDPKFFIHSHSKNMAFRLATGDIVCNINADHFIGKDFAKYVNECFINDPQIVLTAIDYFGIKPGYSPASDVYGKVCVKRDDFNKVGGFYEEIVSYGYEDFDFVNRLELAGLKRSFIEDSSYLKFLEHSIEERFPLSDLVNNIYGTYFHFLTSTETEILVLYNDQKYKTGIFIDASTLNADEPKYSYLPREVDARFPITMKEIKYEQGTWTNYGDHLIFSDQELAKSTINGADALVSEKDNKTFYRVTDNMVLRDMEVFMQTYPGRALMEHNLKNKNIVVNEKFGNGTVFGNFNLETPFSL